MYHWPWAFEPLYHSPFLGHNDNIYVQTMLCPLMATTLVLLYFTYLGLSFILPICLDQCGTWHHYHYFRDYYYYYYYIYHHIVHSFEQIEIIIISLSIDQTIIYIFSICWPTLSQIWSKRFIRRETLIGNFHIVSQRRY